MRKIKNKITEKIASLKNVIGIYDIRKSEEDGEEKKLYLLCS